MRKKTLVKLTVTVMAMAMMLGFSITAMADMLHDPDGVCAGGTLTYKGPKTGYVGVHLAKCSICNMDVEVECTPTGAYSTAVESRTHSQTCSVCGEDANSVSCTLGAYVWKDGTSKHTQTCSVCDYVYESNCEPMSFPIPLEMYGYEKHGIVCKWCNHITTSPVVHTYGADGKCTACSYRPHSSSPAGEDPKNSAKEEVDYTAVIEETVKKEETLPVSTFTSANAIAMIPSEAKTNADTSTGNVYNLSSVTTTQGFVAAVNKIATAEAASTAVTVYSQTPIAFTSETVNAVANTNKNFVYMFYYGKYLYKVTIPAGTKLNLNSKFAGPLYIGAQLGTTQIVGLSR